MGHNGFNGALRSTDRRLVERVARLLSKGALSTKALRRLIRCTEVELIARLEKTAITLPCENDNECFTVRGTVRVGPLVEMFKPQDFLRPDSGALVLGLLAKSIFSAGEPVDRMKAVQLTHWDLARDTCDHEVCLGFSKEYAVELWHIDWLINHERNGERCVLFDDTYAANYFFVRDGKGNTLKIRVVWQEKNRRWVVSAWRPYQIKYHKGDRVFHR